MTFRLRNLSCFSIISCSYRIRRFFMHFFIIIVFDLFTFSCFSFLFPFFSFFFKFAKSFLYLSVILCFVSLKTTWPFVIFVICLYFLFVSTLFLSFLHYLLQFAENCIKIGEESWYLHEYSYTYMFIVRTVHFLWFWLQGTTRRRSSVINGTIKVFLLE